MTQRERFIRTVERRDVDRPASWLGLPTPDALPRLMRHFQARDFKALKDRIGDDVWPIEVPYHHPPAHHIACAFDFAKDHAGNYEERTLTTPGFFENIEDVSAVDTFPWPNPADHMTPAACAAAAAAAPPEYAGLGILWSAHFQDSCAAFGMESALMTMLTAPEMFAAVNDRILDFYLAANRIFLDAAADRLTAVLIGNDLGSQSGLLLSPDLIRRHVWPGSARLVAQAKSYGLKVIYHSCGAIREIIPDLIAMGVDVIHPLQALAAGMDAEEVRQDFGDQVSFCGGIDAQRLLVRGTPAAVAQRTRALRALFPTGLVISPSHEAILPDIPPENIAALFEAVQASGAG
ncbi:MAG: uroporphyrinogen decarboxylase family protein [Candidatus Marinimicrobia bacterium]|nr:uroporphyrinogen decarboxylase family protein [Candidatus Neomarinimicrobiota bacterium]